MSAPRTIDDNEVWEFKNQIKTTGGIDLGGGALTGPVRISGLPSGGVTWWQPDTNAQALINQDNVVMNQFSTGNLYFKPMWMPNVVLRYSTATVSILQNATTTLSWTSTSFGFGSHGWPFVNLNAVPTSPLIINEVYNGFNTNSWFRATLKWTNGTALTQNNQFIFNRVGGAPAVIGGTSTTIGANFGSPSVIFDNIPAPGGFSVDIVCGSQALTTFQVSLYLEII